MSKRDEYLFTTITTGGIGQGGKLKKMLRNGWEVVATERYGYSMNKITMRRPNPKYKPAK
jgi:hypothetical protein